MNKNFFLDSARSGVFKFSPQHRELIQANVEAAGQKVVIVPIGQMEGRYAVLQAIGRHLGFPEWYGANLDALYDCLTDPDYQTDTGLVLVISGLDRLRHADSESFSILTEVFRSASEARQDSGSPLWILLDTPADNLPSLPIP